jgi:Zn-dependent metalloprotease
MHRGDRAMEPRFRALQANRSRHPGFVGIAGTAGHDLARLDPETAARHHLMQALEDDVVPELTTPKAEDVQAQFTRLGTEYVPLSGTQVVKFREAFNNIPVYGSLVSVELDEHNECLSISSALGEPKGVDPVASVAPTDVVAKAATRARIRPQQVRSVPRLHYYFDASASRWRLVYILEDVRVNRRPGAAGRRPALEDFVFDAHSGALVAELPRAPRAARTEVAKDADGADRSIQCQTSGTKRVLSDGTLNVHTYDFGLRDPDTQETLLPGSPIANPPAPWSPAAVSAHANAEDVARFLRGTVKRNNLDNRGGAMISSIRCVVRAESRDGQQWLNAYWNGKQMVYGQRRDGNGFRTMAANVDVVGHEMFHGVTDYTARLEYANQSGALNESYSDIFGVIISNRGKSSIAEWDWRVGEGLDAGGAPFRDMSNPEKFDQPRHMRSYRRLPNTEDGDWGGVHINSGIHNYAMYRITTARSGRPMKYVFAPEEVAAVFYICLTQYLSRRSTFADSRRGVLLAARTLFRNDRPDAQRAKLRALERGFSAAGIEDVG